MSDTSPGEVTRRTLFRRTAAATAALPFLVTAPPASAAGPLLEETAMSSLLMSLLDLQPTEWAALAPEQRARLRKTLYAVLGSTILGDSPADMEANAAIGHFLAEGLMPPPAPPSAVPETDLDVRVNAQTALRERLRPALEQARFLDCVPDDPPSPRPRY